MSRLTTTPFRTCRPGGIRTRHAQPALHVVALCLLSTSSWATTIDGKVINRSTGEPARGDEVILYRVDRSMHEEAHARTGEYGEFHFDTPTNLHHLVAVRHQNVAYHTRTMRGTSRLEVPVYDAVARVEQVREDSDTLFFGLTPGMLNVTEFFVLSNASTPPRTLAGSNTFKFAIPADATLDLVAVQPPQTLPFETKSRPSRKPGQYGIASPIRPGLTRVRVKYSLSYSGSASFQLQVLRPVTAMALMVPESMQLILDRPDIFLQTAKDNGLSVYMATHLEPGRLPRFWLSSVGKFDTADASAKGTPGGSDIEASLPDFPPETSSGQGFFADMSRTLFLCFMTPTVIITLVIVVAMLRNRSELSTRQGDQPKGLQTSSLREDGS